MSKIMKQKEEFYGSPNKMKESSFVHDTEMEIETALGLALPWMLTSMIVAISEITASCINIRTVIGVSHRHDFSRFREFL